MPGDILDLIDNVLSDPFTSGDAMRWNPEAATTEAGCRNSADFSLAMLPPLEPYGELSLYQPVPPFLAEVQPGMVIAVDGEPWRVTDRREGPNGSATFELEPYEP